MLIRGLSYDLLAVQPEIISFDVWRTLISGNPLFRREKCALIRSHFGLSCSDEIIGTGFIRADMLLDKMHECFLLQPDYLTAWAIVLHEIGVTATNRDDLHEFLHRYNQLFLAYPPLLFDDVPWLFEQLANVSLVQPVLLSNTLLILGATLDAFLKTTVLKEIAAFYSDSHYPKPDGRAFLFEGRRPVLHVGDNPATDGKCALYGIEFYQVRSNGKSLKDFWDYFAPRL